MVVGGGGGRNVEEISLNRKFYNENDIKPTLLEIL